MFTAAGTVRRGRLTIIAGCVVALGLFGTTGAGVGASAAGVPQAAVAGVPSWATPANRVGAADPNQVIELRLWLGWRDEAAAAALAREVSTPGSPLYRQFLSTSSFIQRFAPDAAQVQAVQQWAAANGFGQAEVPASRLYVGVTAPVARVEQVFQAPLAEYTYEGVTMRAPASAPVVPSALDGRVRDVQGLDEHEKLYRPDHIGPDDQPAGPQAPPPTGFANAPPCSQYWGQLQDTTDPAPYGTAPNIVGCGQTPQSLRQAYGVSDAIGRGVDGRGYTVVVVDAWSSPTIVSDVNQWSQNHGVPQLASGQYTDATPPGLDQAPEGPSPANGLVDPQGWSTEETLDVEAIHGIAPGANIVYDGAVTPENLALEVAELNAIERHLGDEVSNSWGAAGNGTTEDQDIWDQMLAMSTSTGIGVYFSSGDSGAVEFPSALPAVTAVGGTSMELDSTGSVGLETGWETAKTILNGGVWSPTPPGAYQYGGGGGATTFAQPAYQQGVVPSPLAAHRVVPDVAAVGDPTTGLVIGQTQAFSDGTRYGEFREGGTSLSCPLFAGLMTLVSQSQQTSTATHTPVGFPNPALYKLYGTQAFRDVQPLAGPYGEVRHDYLSGTAGATNTTLRTFDVGEEHLSHLLTTAGYDDVTGIGTPNGELFLSLGAPPPAPVPESPLTPLLPLGAVALAGAAAASRHARRTRPRRVAPLG